MKRLLFAIVFLAVTGCKNISSDHRWQVKRDRLEYNPDTKPYQPLFMEVSLKDGVVRNVDLVSPLIIDTDSVSPSNVYKHLTTLNDRSRRISFKTSWYIVKITNLSSRKKWACVVKSPGVAERVFITKFYSNDTLLELKGEKRFEPGYREPTGHLFTLDIEPFEDFALLFKFTSNEPSFVKEISLYAFVGSKNIPVSYDLQHGIVIGISIFLILLFFYFLVLSKDLAYFFFVLHLVVKVAEYITGLYGSRHVEAFLFLLEGSVLSIYAVLLVVPFKRNRWTKKASFVTALFAFSAVAHLPFLAGFHIGSHITLLFDLIVLIIYLFYAFDSNRNDRANKATRVLIAATILLNALMVLNPAFNYFNAIPGNLFFLMSSGVLHLVLLISILVIRFYSFKKTQQELQVIKASNLQKQISETVLKTQEEEMKRISKDIHDELGSNLALLKIKLHSTNIEKEKSKEIIDLLNRTSGSARAIAYNLMPPYFSETDFKMILFAHFNGLSERGDMKFDLHFSGDPQISKEKELMIYRIITEMASNCLKHSNAKNVRLEFITLDTSIEVICSDDGTGIAPDATSGIGMQSIYSRASYLGGNVRINSSKAGTRIQISIPIKSQPS